MIKDPETGRTLFSKSELQTEDTQEVIFHEDADNHLLHLRLMHDYPMHVSGPCRTPEHNAAIGGHPTSAHLIRGGVVPGAFGWDFDQLTDGFSRASLMSVALVCGWCVGIMSPTALHLDLRCFYHPEWIGKAPFSWVYKRDMR